MKIQANMDLLRVPQYGTEPRERKMVNDIFTKVNDQPVKVTISEEGFERYREKITNGQSFEEVQAQRELLLEGNISPDMNYKFTLSAKVNSLNEADKEVSGTGYLSNEDKLDNIMEAYTSLYDEIV